MLAQTTIVALSLLQASSLVAAKTVKVTVGAGGLVYTPNTIQADVGDFVAFDFVGGRHTVTEGNFNSACQPASESAFYSGTVTPNGPGSVFTIAINSTEPIYYFCSTPNHCKGGMVGAINPRQGGLEDYTSRASASTGQGAPQAVAGGRFSAGSAGNSTTSRASGAGTTTSRAATGTTSRATVGTTSRAGNSTSTTRTVAQQTRNIAAQATPFLGGLAAVGLFALGL